jgi:hypothetical protein
MPHGHGTGGEVRVSGLQELWRLALTCMDEIIGKDKVNSF